MRSNLLLIGFALTITGSIDAQETEVATKAQAVLRTHCYRCHGQDGAVDGGMNYITDLARLVARRKVVPGKPEASPIWKRIANETMPPSDAPTRLTEAEKLAVKAWIEAGAKDVRHAPPTIIGPAEINAFILADLAKIDRRARRFQRYFSLTHLANAGLGAEELETYRAALSKLVNSLSWHPKIRRPEPIDPNKTILRIDLRWYLWDAVVWNRILQDYPYGVIDDSVLARSIAVQTGTRLPTIRADWFIAVASRPPLYFDMLQLPASANELERQLRIDSTLNILQERVMRAGFNGSGVSRNNRILERHDSVHGAYWRTYDFEEVPQNLVERGNLAADRRNIFAYPLGPGNLENFFQHVGGEIIFSLPNRLHGFMLVNAVGNRIEKGPVNIVSDPKRPDRAVETGVSCMSCHVTGILQKADQIREHLEKNPGLFKRSDADLIRALYPRKEETLARMAEDAEQYRQAIAEAGAQIRKYEAVSTMTLRYEAELDLPLAAAEVGLSEADFVRRIQASPLLTQHVGILTTPGGTVARQVWVQAFADLSRELKLGTLLQQLQVSGQLPDNTGEIDPLEGASTQANAMAGSSDGRRLLMASADRSVRYFDVEAGRDVRRFVGHTASVWSVAVSKDGRSALSGSIDGSIRLWDTSTGREERLLLGHDALVSALAFSTDGKSAISGSFDGSVIFWDLTSGTERKRLNGLQGPIAAVALSPDDKWAFIADERRIVKWRLDTAETPQTFTASHNAAVSALAVSSDGKRLVSGSDDRTAVLWDLATGKPIRIFKDHDGYVKAVAFNPNGNWLLTGATDGLVRLWESETGKLLGTFRKHAEGIVLANFTTSGRQTVSGSRDSAVHIWNLEKFLPSATPPNPPTPPTPPAVKVEELREMRTLKLDGLLGPLQFSANRRWLYALNRSSGKLIRLDAEAPGTALEFSAGGPALAFALAPDAKSIFALHEKGLAVIDPPTLKVRKLLPLETEFFDLAADAKGLLYLSRSTEKDGDAAEIAVIDPSKDAIIGSIPNQWGNATLHPLGEKGKLVSVIAGRLAVIDPSSPKGSIALESKDAAIRSPSILLPNGTSILCPSGAVLPLTGSKSPLATLDPWIGASIDSDTQSVVLVTPTGWVKAYGLNDFALKWKRQVSGLPYQAIYDAKRNRLYVAVISPTELRDRSRSSAPTEIRIYGP